MAILTGIKLKSQLNASSLKQKFIKQNKQLFGNEIYLRKLSISKSKKVKIHDSWYISLKNEFDKELTVSPELQKAVNDHHQLQRETATTLIDVAGL